MLLIATTTFTLSACARSSAGPQSPAAQQALREVMAIKMPSTQGKAMSISDHHGKIVMLHFIASWCRDCAVEAASLKNLHDSFKGSKFEIVGVAVDDEPFQLQNFASNFQLPFPILLDATGELKSFFSIDQLPTTMILDQKGTPIYFKDPQSGAVTAKIEGTRTWDTIEPVEMIAGLVERGD